MGRDREERLQPALRPEQKAFIKEPCVCVLCGWRPGTEMLAGLPYPMLVAPDWVECPNCNNGLRYKRSEMLALQEAGEVSRPPSPLRLAARHAREARKDDVKRNHKPGGGGGGGGGSGGKGSGGGKAGPDDDYIDFGRKLKEASERVTMENLTERVFVRLPQSLVESLKQSAAALDVSISEIFRDSLVEWRHYLHCDPPKPETRKPVEFMVTPQQLQLFEAMAKKHGKFEQHHSGTKTRMVYKLLKGWLK